MLVESMNPDEITKEVIRDFNKLKETTAERLGDEYDRERRKLKISVDKTYPKAYPIKTASKNTWLLFLSKAPSQEKYKGRDSINVSSIVYYYNSRGLRVIYRSSGNFLEIYNGHFFKRYNERMNLRLERPLDIVKSYFMYGNHSVYSMITKNDKEYTIGVSSEGILLGEFSHNRSWLINKTFISRDLSRPDQDEVEYKLIDSLKKEIEKALRSPSPGLYEDKIRLDKNIVNALTNIRKD
jgi:hypothetical protein